MKVQGGIGMTQDQKNRLECIRKRSIDAFVHPTVAMQKRMTADANADIDWLVALVDELVRKLKGASGN